MLIKLYIYIYNTIFVCYQIIKQPENQQKSRSNSQSRERDNEYQGENSEGISVEEELSDERYISYTKYVYIFLFNLSIKIYWTVYLARQEKIMKATIT